MSRRHAGAVVLLSLAITMLGRAPWAAAATSSVHIRKVDTTSFPRIELTIALGKASKIEASSVKVTENGRAVGDVAVRALGASEQAVDVVLAIDTSGSMQGQPMSAAVAAALRFVTTLPEHIRVGILTFADNTKPVQRLTTEHDKVLTALAELKPAGETSLYDAVVAAADMFSGTAQRNIILLSDGADTVSSANLNSAAAAAKRRKAVLFTVGLKSSEADVTSLRTLAQETGGRYAPAATAKLADVYRDLATELSNQYVVAFDSEQNAGTQADIAVEALGASDSALILMPEIEEAPKPAPAQQPVEQPEASLVDRISVSGLLLYTFLATFLLALAGGAWGARTRAVREFASRVRITQVGPDLAEDTVKSMMGWVPDSIVHAAEAMAQAGGFTGNLEKKLERAGAPIRVGEFVVGSALAALAGAIVAMSLLPHVLFSLLMAGVAAWVPSIALAIAAHRRSDKLHGQLADVLTILASSLRAGHSFMQALDMVAKEIGEPAAHEFGRVVAETRLGRPINEAMDALAERIGSEDFKWALLAVNIQREVGGNLAEILDTVSDTMRERDTIRRQIGVLTAEGRLSMAILTGLPIALALYMAKVNPSYIGLLFSTRLGVLMTFTACCMLVVGAVWMRKVVKIDV
jgi:tight adherence protein B